MLKKFRRESGPYGPPPPLRYGLGSDLYLANDCQIITIPNNIIFFETKILFRNCRRCKIKFVKNGRA